MLTFYGVSFDPETGVLSSETSPPVTIKSKKCVQILQFLFERQGNFATTYELLGCIYPDRRYPQSETLKVFVSTLRTHLRQVSGHVEIQNVRRPGYRLVYRK